MGEGWRAARSRQWRRSCSSCSWWSWRAGVYEVKAAFRDTSGINAGSPVRIAGVEVGEVTDVAATRPGARSATLTLAIRDKGLPIYDDATAKIRPRIFLEGNFFVELTPGTPRADELDAGATLAVDRTASPVQFDQVLSALQSDTRNDLRQIFAEVGRAQDAGGAKAFSESLRFQPAAYKFTAIVSEALLGKRPGDLGDFVRDAGTTAAAINEPRRLATLIGDFNTTAAAFAAREDALTSAVGELPRTLRAATPAFDSLNAAFPDVRRFSRDARPGVRSLGPTVDAALPLVRELRGLVGESELGSLARNLRSATPPLAQVATTGVSVLGRLRELASCVTNVIVPFGDDKIEDKAFPTHGPVYQDLAKFLPGLAGESRSFDPNGPYFKVQGGRWRRDAEHRQRAVRHGRRADPRQQPAADPPAPAAEARRAVRDAGAAGPALDPQGPAAHRQHRQRRLADPRVQGPVGRRRRAAPRAEGQGQRRQGARPRHHGRRDPPDRVAQRAHRPARSRAQAAGAK